MKTESLDYSLDNDLNHDRSRYHYQYELQLLDPAQAPPEAAQHKPMNQRRRSPKEEPYSCRHFREYT